MSEKRRCHCLVIGGGIAGMESAITLADMGFQVVLVEKEASIGGKMILLSKVFPTLDCASCIATPKMAQTANHPGVETLVYTEVRRVERTENGFRVTLRRKPTYVDPAKCTGCGQCEKVCTVGRPDQFQEGLVPRRAIYIPFPQAVPKKAVIEKRALSPCSQTCPAGLRPHALVALVRAGRPIEAYERALEESPIPGVLCRLCAGYCESRCTRGKRDRALPIRGLQAFVSRVFHESGKEPAFPPAEKKGQKIAVFGSGPESLTLAYFLARRGFSVKIFDSAEKAGGIFLDWGVPGEILETELKNLKGAGVEIEAPSAKTPQEVKGDFDLVLVPREEEGEGLFEALEEGVLSFRLLAKEKGQVALGAALARRMAGLVEDFLAGALSEEELLKEPVPEFKLPQGQETPPPVFLDLVQAQERARACLDCGVCSECRQCVRTCPAGAIDFSMKPEEIEVDCGAVVVATGFKLYDPTPKSLLGYAAYPNVITAMQMDRLLAPTRPYNWVLRPSDGKLPGNIAIVLCVGSRDRTGGTRLCSRICCMYSIKQAQLIMGALPIAEITIYYMDIRAFGKGYEEFFQQAKAMGVHFVRGRVARIEETTNQDLYLYFEDMERKGGMRRARHDLVVLAHGALPQSEVQRTFKEGPRTDEFGFFQEADEDLEPGKTNVPGVFVAGAACGPRDIPDTVVHAGATVAQVAAYLKQTGWV